MKISTSIKILAILYGIAGAYTGYTIAHNIRVRKWLNRDAEKITKLARNCDNIISIKDIDESEVPEDIRKKADDPKDPMDPTVIYVYD